MESPPWPENLCNDRKMAVQELICAYQLAAELSIRFQDPHGNPGSMSIQTVASKILQSIEGAFLVLNSNEVEGGSQHLASTNVSSCSVEEGSKCSRDSERTSVQRDPRGRSKRRKIMETWTEISKAPYDDHYVWRKYGQKEILGAKYKRSYYRCTYKSDQGCEATKKVQRKEDNPLLYLITYEGRHTCKDPIKSPPFILDSPPRGAFTLDFEKPFKNGQEPLWFSAFASSKEGSKQDQQNNLTDNQMSTMGFPTSSNHPMHEPYQPTMRFSMPESESSDVASGLSLSGSPHTLVMNVLEDCGLYHDLLSYDNGEDFL